MSNNGIDSLEQVLSAGINQDSELNNADQLVFPINVEESLRSTGSLQRSEKNGIILSFWLIVCFIIGWVLMGWLRPITPRWYPWIIVAVELLLQLTIGVVILRVVLDERVIISEADNKDNSFTKYFHIYHEIISQEGSVYPFDIIEFSDGSYGVYIKFLLGYNTTVASNSTYEINISVQKLINRTFLPHRIIYNNELFNNSEAAEKLRASVKDIKDPRLFKVYRDIVQDVLTIAKEESNVLCATYIIYAKTQIQKEELTGLVTSILATVQQADTAYRQVSVMTYEEIVEFYRTYYKLDVLDMGMVRAHQAQKKKSSASIKVLKLYGTSGKVYTTSHYSSLRDKILETEGLVQVNKRK